MTKSRYIHSEVYKYETYVEALRSAIALRVKKQGEKKLERSLARSMTSLHRRESADANTDMDESEYEVPDGLRIDTGLKVDAGKGDEEETAVTPMAARRTRGVEEGRYRCRLWT